MKIGGIIKKGNIVIMPKTLHKYITFLLLFLIPCLFGVEENITEDSSVNYEICSPIAIQSNSAVAALHSKILGDTDIDLAIFLNGESAFEAVILSKKQDGYKCDFRMIYYDDVYSDEGLDKNLISACKVHVKSKPIDQKMVDILKETLKNQIEKATYKVAPGFKWTNQLDGSVYSVYIKGSKNDVFPIYSAMFFNPKVKGSYRCDAINLALKIFATNENDDFRTVPITDLTNYLIDIKEGRNPATDPSINKSIPDPEFEVPPPHK